MVVRIPARPDTDDHELLWDVALKIADIIKRNAGGNAVSRQHQIAREIAALSEPA